MKTYSLLCPRLDYPKDKFELLFVNDHATDGSDTAIQMAIATLRQSRLIELGEGVEGKKAALTQGIAQAQGTIIATTDADCLVPANWLFRINEAFQTEKIKIIFGGVSLRQESALFSAVQALEFYSLVGDGASLLNWGLFIMCNGANMAFLRSAFNQFNGYQGNTTIASGDDVFLAEKNNNPFSRLYTIYSSPRCGRYHCSTAFDTSMGQPARTVGGKVEIQYIYRSKMGCCTRHSISIYFIVFVGLAGLNVDGLAARCSAFRW